MDSEQDVTFLGLNLPFFLSREGREEGMSILRDHSGITD